ncbi:MAG: hypothetical protein NTW85_04610 [Methylococcales bacterium]|nr:hypothetical protein [Methylococcales bacterium]
MIEFIIAIAVIALAFYFLKIKNKKTATTLESAKPIKQETKPADNIVASTESKPVQMAVESVNKPAIAQAAAKIEKSPEPTNENLPQDATLRRHYLTHLRAIISSINPQCPTDSALARHHNAQIAAQLEQFLSSKEALQQLFARYENHKKKPAPSVVEKPEAILVVPVAEEIQAIITPSAKPEVSNKGVVVSLPERKASKIPEDSQLKRHYVTHLYNQVAVDLPARPTDSTLRRHHDTLLENEVKSRLSAQS